MSQGGAQASSQPPLAWRNTHDRAKVVDVRRSLARFRLRRVLPPPETRNDAPCAPNPMLRAALAPLRANAPSMPVLHALPVRPAATDSRAAWRSYVCVLLADGRHN